MPDNIERTIYKLEIDGEGYIRGLEQLTASTQRLSQEQERTNQTLKTNEAALRVNTDRLNKAKADLEAYTGTNARYRKQLEKDVQSAEKDQAALTELVNKNRIAYEQATKAAQDFANTSARAAQLPSQPGAKIPTPTVIPPVIPQLGTGIQDALKNISLGDLPETLRSTLPEFEQLRAAIEQARIRMSELNEEDEEFKQLAPIVAQGEEALRNYDHALKATDNSHKSLRTQLREGREALVLMEQQGKSTSKEYIELEKHVARLTDEFGDQQERIRVLASDTRLLDFGKASIQAATAAFQTYASVSILVGDENEDLQKKTLQLFAAMQLLTSLETLANSVKRGSIITTNLQSAATAVYTAVVGTSTGALKAFRVALLATGIGAAVVAIGFLVNKYIQYRESIKKVNEEQKILKEINESAAKSFSGEVVHLELIRQKLTDLSIPQSKRIALAKEYNKTADEGNKIDLKSIDNIGKLNTAIDSQIAKIKERALAKAAENVITQKAEALFIAQEVARTKAQKQVAEESRAVGGAKQLSVASDQEPVLQPGQTLQIFDPKKKKFVNKVLTEKDIEALKKGAKKVHDQYTKYQEQGRINRLIEQDKDVKDAQEALDRAVKIASPLINIDDLIPLPPQTKDKAKTENVFEQERQKQKERLAELLRKSVEDEKTIRAQFEEQLITEKQRIDGLLKDKKLTKPQAETLKIEAAKINTVELDKALEDFRKKVADARKKLNDELRDLQQKAIEENLNLIQDEFTRRAALIDFNEKKEIEEAKKNTQDRLDALELDRLLIGEQKYQEAKAIIIANGEQKALNIIQEKSQERKDLAFDVFKNSIENIEEFIQTTDISINEAASKEVHNLSERFLSGQINYEKFQKELTKIQKKYELQRRQNALDTEREELRRLENEIAGGIGGGLNAKQLEELIKKRDELKAKISKDQQDIDESQATGKNDIAKQRADQVTQYSDAIGRLAESVVSFWQKANEAEQKALDKSIELQQKRVDAAQRLAERGNAQYLKEEEDRLQELEVKRENAARRQLAIDTALQASQLLVGITGAIAKISTGVGAAEAIAEIAIIVGALATGYGLVKQLQSSQPRLAEGTTYVSSPTAPKGKDKIPAWLDEGEAVIPAQRNEKYKAAVEAIYHEKVPANVMNEFVSNYSTSKPTENKYVYDSHNQNLSTYKNFVSNVSNVPTSVLHSFINNYGQDKHILPTHLIERSRDFSSKAVNNFMDHQIRSIPQLNTEKIKQTIESKTAQDSSLSRAIADQNRKIDENNELLRINNRLLKSMGINVNMDKNGIAVSVMEAIEQMNIDKRR